MAPIPLATKLLFMDSGASGASSNLAFSSDRSDRVRRAAALHDVAAGFTDAEQDNPEDTRSGVVSLWKAGAKLVEVENKIPIQWR